MNFSKCISLADTQSTQRKRPTVVLSPISKETLQKLEGQLGFLPYLYGALGDAPAALDGYLSIASIFEKSSLSPTEQQLVLLAVSTENSCEYCVAAHSFIGKNMVKIDAALIDALREGNAICRT